MNNNSSFIYKIKYGVIYKNVDVTDILVNAAINNIIYIQIGDHNRCLQFKIDPVPGTQKSIYIKNVIKNEEVEYDVSKSIYIDITSNQIYIDNPPRYINEILTNYYNSLQIKVSSKKTYLLHPITFSIPEEKIVKTIPQKTKVLSVIIPGSGGNYSFTNEIDYYNEYKQSMFGTTFKKGGWDCLRHYEIIANGCIPYFMNMELCPEKILYLYPKQLTMEGNKLFLKLKNKSIHEILPSEKQDYDLLVTKFLEYARENLTTIKIAKYILDKSNNINAAKILYLSVDLSPDYLRCLTLHGFKSVFGKNCHDYPQIPHIYKYNNYDYGKLYGRGMTYTNLLDSNMRDNNLDNSIQQDIENHVYDIIIYGSYHRGIPYFEKIKKYYSSDQIIFLCGEDDHICDYGKYISEGYNVFVRELNNDGCGIIPNIINLN